MLREELLPAKLLTQAELDVLAPPGCSPDDRAGYALRALCELVTQSALTRASMRLLKCRAGGGYFTLEYLGDFTVKGASAPVRVHRLVSAGKAATRFDVSRSRGIARVVGREADVATLEAALQQAQEGHRQVVGAVAQATERACELFRRVKAF